MNNSNNNTKPYTPATIGNISFRIPLYQRPYAWGEAQVKQLLKDLFDAFQKKKEVPKYYIGILSIGKVPNNSNLYDLIDGQQRITTLLLIGKALARYCSNWNIFAKGRLDIYGRQADKEFLSESKLIEGLNPRMINTVAYTNEFIEQINPDSQKDYAKYVYENAAFFLAEMPENYSIVEKNLHFVRMNNRGKQLEQHDIVKIKLANLIKDPVEQSKFVADWNRFAQLGCTEEKHDSSSTTPPTLLEILNSKPETKRPDESEVFYESIVSCPEFLLIALDRFKVENSQVSHTNKDKLLSEFGFDNGNKHHKWECDEVKLFHELLKKQFDVFDKFIIKRDKSEGYKFKASDSNFNGSTKELEMFQAFQYVSKEPHNWLKKAFDYLQDENDDIDRNSFLKMLKINDNNSRKIDNDIKLTYGNSRIRYWFWRLDYYLWENRDRYFKYSESKNVANNYIFRANRSIEHVAPQKPKNGSLITLSASQQHSFGNLAMISAGQNSSLQNESYEIKMAHVDSFILKSVNGTIESLKLLLIKEEGGWNENIAMNHGNKMIDVLIESFSASSDAGDENNYAEICERLAEQK